MYAYSHEFERKEVVFLFISMVLLCILSLVYLIQYIAGNNGTYIIFEISNLIIVGSSLTLLIGGNKNSAAVMLFPVFGNLYLIRIVIMAIYVPYDNYPFTIEIFYSFEILLILATGYFCRRKVYIWFSFATGFICSLLYLLYFSEDFFSSALVSKIMFTIIPTFFAFHINNGRSLLEDYYRVNVNKDREINHRVKNHLSILKSMIQMRPVEDSGTMEPAVFKQEIANTITSFLKIYDRLLFSENVHSLNLYNYLSSLFDDFCSNMAIEYSIETEEKSLFVDSDKAAHIGMAFTELITNSVKYAETSKLKITLEIRLNESDISMCYSDNGLPPATSAVKTDSFGRTIIRSIVVDTLKGRVSASPDSYDICFIVPIGALKAVHK